MKPAKLVLADGTVFEGRAFGAEGERSGEVVFNTAMSGYQEVLTDPSYKGQIVTMTYPHIGNYGVNEEDFESSRPWVEGFVAREFSRMASNHRATADLDTFLRRHGIVAIDGIDTRALTLRLRKEGAMNGVISSADQETGALLEKARKIPSMSGLDLVRHVTGKKALPWRKFLTHDANGKAPEPKYRVAALDLGIKFNIIRSLVRLGCDVTVFPATASAKDLAGYDGLFLSNGPGDPSAVTYAIETLREVLKTEVPIFGICLGHQILSLALGAKVYKLKFGHHGANHPVKRIGGDRVEITSQNHGFAVDEKSVAAIGAEVSHINLNDGTVEGIRHTSRPIFSVQYHPEASPGPRDASPLFGRFVDLMDQQK